MSNIILNSDAPVSSNAEEFYRDYWQLNGSEQQKDARRDEKHDFIFNYLLRGPVQGQTILEIGIGGLGGMVSTVQESNSVYGLDVSASAIASCKALGIPVEQVNCDRDCFPYADATFDIVLAFEVFEHFANPQFVIEQIRRVLKPNGTLVLSTPPPYTYHWPRAFYPSLFEKDNFSEFLLCNRFETEVFADPFYQNLYALRDRESIESSWSYYWLARSIAPDDSAALHEAGVSLFQKKDPNGMRTRPIEALELFERSVAAGGSSVEITSDYLCALCYRAINGDTGEFTAGVKTLMEKVRSATEKSRYAAALLSIHQEVEWLGQRFIDEATVTELRRLCRQ